MLAVGLAVAGTACGGSGAVPATGDSAAAQTPNDQEPRLWLKQGDQKAPFQNGDSVAVADLNVEVYVSPFPPRRTSNIDFYVTRAGQPVERANVTLQYDMTVMEHGPFQLLAAPTGRGHYLAPVDFAMDGEFWLNVALDVGAGESVINMLVRAVR